MRCKFLHQYLIFKTIGPLNPAPIEKYSELYLKIQMLTDKHPPLFCRGVLVWFKPQKYIISLYISHFLFHLGTHWSNTGEVLENYHLYHEEASFYRPPSTI